MTDHRSTETDLENTAWIMNALLERGDILSIAAAKKMVANFEDTERLRAALIMADNAMRDAQWGTSHRARIAINKALSGAA